MTKKFNSALVWILILSILISTVIILPTIAADSFEITTVDKSKTEVKAYYDGLVTELGDNLLIGKTTYAKTSVWNDTMQAKNWTNLTDGNVKDDSIQNIATTWNDNGNRTDVLDAGKKWYYDLTKTTEIEQISIFNFIDWGKDLEICKFKIYVADDVASLWNDDSKVAAYDISTNDASKAFNVINIAFSDKPQGKFLGIYWDSSCCFRTKNVESQANANKANSVVLSEIALFGNDDIKNYTFTTVDKSKTEIKDYYDGLATELGDNLLVGKTTYAKTSVWNDVMVAKSWTNLTDGNVKDDSIQNISTTWNDNGNRTDVLDAGRKWYYDLSEITEISQLSIFNFIDWGKDLEICKFKVYVADDAENLWSDTSRVATYNTSTNDASKAFNIINLSFKEKPQGRYLGIYWESSCCFRTKNLEGKANANMANPVVLSEIALFGKEIKGEEAEEVAPFIGFLNSLSNGLINSDTKLNDTAKGKLVTAESTGADYSGGINKTSFEMLASMMSSGNMLTNLKLEISTTTGNKIAYPDGEYYSRASDGVINGSTCFQIQVKDSSDVNTPIADSPIKLTYDLGKTASPELFMMGNARGGKQVMMYEIYISDTKDNLYNAENRIGKYDGTQFVGCNKWGNCVEPYATWANEADSLLASFILPENCKGRYFGVLITRGDGNSNKDTVAIGEMAFFAKSFLSESTVMSANEAKTKYDAVNLLKKANGRTDIESLEISAFTDGNYADSVGVDSGKVTYTLNKDYMINSIAVVMPDNARLTDYEIYLARDFDELYETRNKIGYLTAQNGETNNVVVDKLELNSVKQAKYVGFKFKGSQSNIKVNELVATGTDLPKYIVTTEVKSNSDARQYVLDKFGKNRLLNASLEYENTHSSFGYESAKCNDDDYEPFYFERDGGNPKLTFTMRSNILMKNFAISSTGNPYGEGKIRLGEYKVYLSNDKKSLYSSQNCVAHVVGQPHAALAYSSVIDEIELLQAVEAKYVGIEIVKDNLSSSYVGIRVNEFAAFGSPISASVDKTKSFLDSLKNGLIDAKGNNNISLGKAVSDKLNGVDYNGGLNTVTFNKINELYLKKNLLSGKRAEVTVKDGYTAYSEDGTPERLTDGKIDSSSTYSLQVKNDKSKVVPFSESNVYLTYDLGSSKSLELLTVGGARSGDYQQYKYKVYVSNDKDNLYSVENLVSVYDLTYSLLTGGNGLESAVYAAKEDELSGHKPLIAQYLIMSGNSGRYIGIAIAGAKNDDNKVCLGEIALWAARDVYNAEYDSYGLFAEEVFNVFENGDFEDKISDENWGTLNSGFAVTKVDKSVTHGKNALKVNGGKSQTWHFKLKENTEHSFGFYVKSSGGKATVSASCDENGTPFENVIPVSVAGDVKGCTVNTSNTSGNWQRVGYSFYSGEYSDIYITISGISGEVMFDDMMLFRADRGQKTDPNDYKVTSAGYAPGILVVDAETGKKSYETLK